MSAEGNLHLGSSMYSSMTALAIVRKKSEPHYYIPPLDSIIMMNVLLTGF